MAGDIDSALREIVAEPGGMTADGATAFFADLRREHRYRRDAYRGR